VKIVDPAIMCDFAIALGQKDVWASGKC
jgi:hypothetical protein